MNDNFPVKFFQLKFWYPLNLAEGEGLGTTYEYLSKFKYLSSLNLKPPYKQIIIAGLPGKYGFSLDLVALAIQLKPKKIIILDHRPHKLKQLQHLLKNNLFFTKSVQLFHVSQAKLYSPYYFAQTFSKSDLVVNSEVVQNWPFSKLADWLSQADRFTRQLLIYIPNGNNTAHNQISQIKSIAKDKLDTIKLSKFSVTTGYLDMPPFPPGIKRSSTQKNNLQRETIKQFLIQLIIYSWLGIEQSLLKPFHKNYAHLICCFIRTSDNV